MSFQIEQVSAFQKQVNFVIPKEEVGQKLDDAYRNLSHRVRIDGFRPGKVPRRVLEARFSEHVKNEVASNLIDINFRRSAQELNFIGQPEVGPFTLVPGQDFTFAITFQVKPELEVANYKGIEVDFPLQAVSDEQVDATIRQKLSRQAKVVTVEEDREVKAGDLVLTSLSEKKEDGSVSELEAGTIVNTQLDRYYPGLESFLIGLKKGEEKSGTVTIRDTALIPGVKGRTLEVVAKVLEIQESRIPELSDELAAQLNYEGGAEGARVAIRLDLEEKANSAARNVARISLLQKLVAANEVEPPPAMVENHYQMLSEELRIQAAYSGRDPRSFKLSETQAADLKSRALFSARATLILEAIAKTEGITISDEDLDAKYQEIADMRGQRVEAIRGYFIKENAVEELRRRLLEERTLDFVLEAAELKETAATEGGTEA